MKHTEETARAGWMYLLPQIEASRQMTRLVIQNFPADKLDVRPVPHGGTFADMLWYLASVYHVFLDGVCEGKFEELPAMPEARTTEAFLAWDVERFGSTLDKLRALSGEDLLKPVTFAGLTQSALDFMSTFQGNVYQHVGQLVAFLSVVVPEQAVASPLVPEGVVNELSDDELAGVAGGQNPALQVPVTYVNPVANTILVPQQTLTGLGSLFGNGQNNLTGFAAVIPGLALGVGAAAWGQWLMFGTLAFLRI